MHMNTSTINSNSINVSSSDSSSRSLSIRLSNIDSILSLCNSLGTSLGPRGMDKMITDSKNNTIITNDGATILSSIKYNHPIISIVTSMSKSQDKECGDGTTTVVLLLGSILEQIRPILLRGVHPSYIVDSIYNIKDNILDSIREISQPILNNNNKDDDTNSILYDGMVTAAITALASKSVSSYDEFAGSAVEAVLSVQGDMSRIKVVKRVGGGLDESYCFNGVVLENNEGLLPRKKKSRVALIQYCLSAPKTNLDHKIILSNSDSSNKSSKDINTGNNISNNNDAINNNISVNPKADNNVSMTNIDKVIKEERSYILGLCKSIRSCNIDTVFVQKSILREGVSTLAKHFLNKMGITVISEVDREDLLMLSGNLGCRLISDSSLLDNSRVVECNIIIDEENIKIESNIFNNNTVTNNNDTVVNTNTILHNKNSITSVVVRGVDTIIVEEGVRSMYDALWVAKTLFDSPYLIPGGGTPEMAVYRRIINTNNIVSMAIARAFEKIPYLIAKNAGVDPLITVSAMKLGRAGVDIRKGGVVDMLNINVMQPMRTTLSAVGLAIETACMVLLIDDILPSSK